MFKTMKHVLAGTAVAACLILPVEDAYAAPAIAFDVAGAPASSATATLGGSFCIGCSVSTTISGSLEDQVFSLAKDESRIFEFFDITVSGFIGGATFDVSATLSFTLPDIISVPGNGNGLFVTVAGVLSAGVLIWEDLPKTVTLGDGSSFSVDFSDIFAFGFGNTATVRATVTALEVAVPEPASLAVLGMGLLGLGFVRRRKATPLAA